MRQLQPVIWSKGTFLTPQHLQTQDRFAEDSLTFRLQSLACCAYGFDSLQVSFETLAEGRFQLSSASGIMPDGLLFDIPASDPVPQSKEFADHLDAEHESVDVYLALPESRQHTHNISMDESSGARYLIRTELIRDETTGANEKAIQLASKNFRLLVGDESHEGSCVMRIARIQRTANGAFHLEPSVVPPLLSVGCNDYLAGILRGLVERLAAKSTVIANERREKNENLADFTASDIGKFWLLYTVNSHLASLQHYFNLQMIHPEILFAEMIALGGSLTTFSKTVRAQDLPAYDHDDLGDCFSKLNIMVLDLLEAVIPTNFVSLSLKKTQPAVYATAIDQDRYLSDTRLYLAISSNLPKAELIRRAPQVLKVCSASHIDRLVRQALPGLKLTHLAAPPAAVPVALKFEYFELEPSGAAWEAVCRARNLAVYAPDEIGEATMELVILLPQTSGRAEQTAAR